MKITNQILIAIVLIISEALVPVQAVTMDEHITCSLIYGALFQVAKNADHEQMLSYTRPRLQAVMPFLQENKDNSLAKERLKDISTRLEDEIHYSFVNKVTDAIRRNDYETLKTAMHRVFQCDKLFGLTTLPLPLKSNVSKQIKWNGFLEGFYDGCLAKQRRNLAGISDSQIKSYCRCITDQAAKNGTDESSSEQTIGRVINESHSRCVAAMQ